LQAEIYASPTEVLLRSAGITAGMRVLDVGCGAGDVAMQVAKLVGAGGSVVAVDNDPDVVALARRRAEELGVLNVRFQVSDLLDLQLDVPDWESDGRLDQGLGKPVDAVVGRLILMHLDDPVAAVRHLATVVRPGGVITFQDFNTTRARSVPAAPLLTRCMEWAVSGLIAAGRPADPGEQLAAILHEAGLPTAETLALGPATADPGSPYYDYLVATISSLLPMIEKTGTTADDIDLPTLTQRLRAEARRHQTVCYLPELTGAWTRRGVEKPARHGAAAEPAGSVGGSRTPARP
jgi:SAM-dependent methyltransferase